MTPAVQSALALGAVAVATAYLARRAWTAWSSWRVSRVAGRRETGCGPDCGCS